MRLALAIMGELEAELLGLDDFELLVTGLKVTPAKWGLAMLRKVWIVQKLKAPHTWNLALNGDAVCIALNGDAVRCNITGLS